MLIASAILFAPLASWLALQRARSWAIWFVFGVVLGPIASLLLILAPPGRCSACGTRTVGWPRSCANCGLIFGSQPADAPSESIVESKAPIPVMAAPGSARRVGSSSMAARRRARRTAGADAAVSSRAERVDVPVPAGGVPVATADADATEPDRRAATALGRRATEVPAPAPPAPLPAPRRSASGALVILGSGVFLGGSGSLQIGSRYLFARVGSELHILGPIHVSPAAIATRISLGGLEPTLHGDRLLLSQTRGGRGPELAFGAVALEDGVDLATDLQVPKKGRSAST
jgi:hypothetical protein